MVTSFVEPVRHRTTHPRFVVCALIDDLQIIAIFFIIDMATFATGWSSGKVSAILHAIPSVKW
jgi:hypothetical protein